MSDERTWQHRLRTEEETTIITLSGEIDINGAEGLHTLLQSQVKTARRVHVDMARVTFIDSTVITALIKSHHMARATGCHFALVNSDAQVCRVLAVTGVLNALMVGAR